MKKILWILIISILLCWNTLNLWAYSYPNTFSSHTGKYTRVKDGSQMDLKGYLTPYVRSDDAWTGMRSSLYSIEWAEFTSFLKNNGIYWVDGIIGFPFADVSNTPFWLFFENKALPEQALEKKISQKDLSQWLPIYVSQALYNQIKMNSLSEEYFTYKNEPIEVSLKGKIKDFRVNYEVEMCIGNEEGSWGSGNEETYQEEYVCAEKLLPLQQEFLDSAITENPMSKEEFIEEFNDIMTFYSTESFSVDTKIFVADELIVNGKSIVASSSEPERNIDYGSYEHLKKIHMGKLKENEKKVLENLVKKLRKLNVTGKSKQVQKFVSQIKTVVDADYKKMSEIVKRHQGMSDEYIVSQNPTLPKLRERYKLLSTYYTLLVTIVNEWKLKELQKIEVQRLSELREILKELKKNYDEQWWLWFLWINN